MHDGLNKYIELSTMIRELSSPKISDTASAEEYRLDLIKSFNRIGELAKINQSILDEHFFSVVSSDDKVSEQSRQSLMAFKDALIDPVNMENIDLPILYVQTERLLEDAIRDGDSRTIIICLDTMVIVCYAILTSLLRIYPCYDLGFKYRDKGIDAARQLIEYLEPEKFKELDEDCKEIVLINSRYISALFEWGTIENHDKQAAEDIALLERSLSLASDPFYLSEAPNYDWDYHLARTLQYISCYTEFRHEKVFQDELVNKICDYTELFKKEIHERCPYLEKECTPDTQELYLIRNRYLAHRISKEEYKKRLLELYDIGSERGTKISDVFKEFTISYEYILLLDKDNLSEEDKEFLRTFYNGLAKYIYNLPKSAILSPLMTFISCIFDTYIEIDGAPNIQEMTLRMMAALHPPTYVHSKTVAEMTICLASHLIDKEPERFIGVLDLKTPEEVKSKKDELLDFIEEATLMHDVGKIYIIETVMTYGRRLFDLEFDFIKTHPEVGAVILESHERTKEYADMARGHHKWYNDSAGYPEEFKLQNSKYKTIIALLSVADCLDAATDSVGRNYKTSKTFDDYINEIIHDRDTRYAGFAVDLLKDPVIYAEMESILTNSRDENYRQTYNLLKELAK